LALCVFENFFILKKENKSYINCLRISEANSIIRETFRRGPWIPVSERRIRPATAAAATTTAATSTSATEWGPAVKECPAAASARQPANVAAAGADELALHAQSSASYKSCQNPGRILQSGVDFVDRHQGDQTGNSPIG
jgi:hypothetical protein